MTGLRITDEMRIRVDSYLLTNYGIVASRDVVELHVDRDELLYIDSQKSDFF